MANFSPYGAIKELETSINTRLAGIDLFELPNDEREVLTKLKRQIVDARLDIRDYDLSDTRAEQLENATNGRTRLNDVRALILAVSQYGIFSSVDVALFTAQLEQVSDQLT